MTHPDPEVVEIALNQHYKFMYANFVLATQQDTYLALDRSDAGVACLKFRSSLLKYGYPNDEVGHPLMSYGLGIYGFYEVLHSPWITDMRAQNAVHIRDAAILHDGKRHFIAKFKDVTFEVIARDYEEVCLPQPEFEGLVSKEIAFLSD